MNLKEYDASIRLEYGNIVAGSDECGRGCWCAPIFAACVVLPENNKLKNINDSKKLSKERREELYFEITEQALAWSVNSIPASKIDKYGINPANKAAVQNAAIVVKNKLKKIDCYLVDAIHSFDYTPNKIIIKGDSTSESIAAASILCKVERDKYIKQLSVKYPQYNFEKHNGYINHYHIAAVKEYGYIPNEYRETFKVKGYNKT